jgi:Ca2+-transporting ATPase
MGVRGTAVAKEAAAMVLQDDEFGTIVAAIEQGRAIFENIRKFVVYLLSCNISEVLVVSLATIAGAPLPILFLNLVTDVFPALALGVGPGQEALMKSKPRPTSERILTRRHWIETGLHGVVMALVVLSAMAISLRHLINNEITRNIWIWLALALCLVLILMAVYAPVLRTVMQLYDPGLAGWLVITVASLVPLIAAPVVRRIAREDSQPPHQNRSPA